MLMKKEITIAKQRINQILDKYYREYDNNYEKIEFEQYFTSAKISNYMSNMFDYHQQKTVNIMDPGAGIGILGAYIVLNNIEYNQELKEINLYYYEVDKQLSIYLSEVHNELKFICDKNNIKIYCKIIYGDFIKEILDIESTTLFDYIIMNPPYKKIKKYDENYIILNNHNVCVSNYYTAFLSLALRYLKLNGQLVSITPRSFCNGYYFKKFRKQIYDNYFINSIHTFNSREKCFRKDDVLQETIIFRFSKTKNNDLITISSSEDDQFDDLKSIDIEYDKVFLNQHNDYIIRIIRDIDSYETIINMEHLPCTLDDLGIDVSTGPVVDFRVDKDLLDRNLFNRNNKAVIIFTEHIKNNVYQGSIKNPKKYNYIENNELTKALLREKGNYVLVKRISLKEDINRIRSSYISEKNIDADYVTFDNKFNYYHINKKGLSEQLAKGLAKYLNSNLVNKYFNIISGSTQVNVSDLKHIKYPSKQELIRLGNESC